jgi:hypothetical protein
LVTPLVRDSDFSVGVAPLVELLSEKKVVGGSIDNIVHGPGVDVISQMHRRAALTGVTK